MTEAMTGTSMWLAMLASGVGPLAASVRRRRAGTEKRLDQAMKASILVGFQALTMRLQALHESAPQSERAMPAIGASTPFDEIISARPTMAKAIPTYWWGAIDSRKMSLLMSTVKNGLNCISSAASPGARPMAMAMLTTPQ